MQRPASDSDQPLVIVSADCHAGPQHVADYEPYTAAAHKPALREYAACIDAFEAANTTATGAGGRGGALSRDERGLWDMSKRRAHLDADGVAAEVIFTQGSIPFAPYPAVGWNKMPWTATPEQRGVGPEVYNRWLADFCSADPELHYGVAALPIDDVAAAVGEVARARESGLRGGVRLEPASEERQYNDPAYEPLWAACQDHDMVLNLHGGSAYPYRGGLEVMAIVLAETDFFTRRALWFLIFSGVFERYPKLRLALTEQRAHWVPGMLYELDSIYHSAYCSELRQQLPKPPSEYFATNCFIGASFMSRTECEDREQIGVDRLMWGSDYPHAEGVWPWVPEGLRWTFDGVEEAELRRMLGGNAIDCYGFDAAALRRRAESLGPRVEQIAAQPLDAPPRAPGVERSWAFRTTPWV